jgi:hypothetical protein
LSRRVQAAYNLSVQNGNPQSKLEVKRDKQRRRGEDSELDSHFVVTRAFTVQVIVVGHQNSCQIPHSRVQGQQWTETHKKLDGASVEETSSMLKQVMIHF